MSKKPTSLYVCQQCGAQHPRWGGQCSACGAWNTLVEEYQETIPKGLKLSGKEPALDMVSLDGNFILPPRKVSHIQEFDRVCGGGLVPGSVLLVGGTPGIGKSTILLQIMAKLSKDYSCLYVSGEEGVEQVTLRAGRLHVEKSHLKLASSTNLSSILQTLNQKDGPEIVVIDSIQTMYLDSLESAPGSVAQVRSSAHELIRVAKKRNCIVILVGHVTKDGSIAGPKVLEHMVDTVLYFEGDQNHQFRILRSVKNRFGPTDEIGVFEMRQEGLMEVANPSAVFLENRQPNTPGSAVFAGIEGTRPVLVEIQSLVAPSPFAAPKRTTLGWDVGRLSMIIAVLEARFGIPFSGKDVYLNIAGGLKITEPAADLAVAASLLSSLANQALPEQTVIFGEVGLSGEVRAVSQKDARLKEAKKLGFEAAFLPQPNKKNEQSGITEKPFSSLQELITLFEGLQREGRS